MASGNDLPAEPEKNEDADDAAILNAAMKPNATVAGLSRKFHRSRATVRELLRRHDVVLPSQTEAKGGAAPVDEREAIAESTNESMAALVSRYAKGESEERLQEIFRVGVLLVDRLRPTSRAQGLLVDQLIDRALESDGIVRRLRAEFELAARGLGYDVSTQFLDFLRIKVRAALDDLPRVDVTVHQREAEIVELKQKLAAHEPLAIAVELFKTRIVAEASAPRRGIL